MTQGSKGVKSKLAERKELLKQRGLIDGDTSSTIDEMIAAGHSLDEPYLAALLRRQGQEQLQQLRVAKLRLPEGNNVFMAVPDFTRTLLPGTCMAVRKGKGLAQVYSAGASTGEFDLLVYHAPGAHAHIFRR